jgi:hypothetical protein
VAIRVSTHTGSVQGHPRALRRVLGLRCGEARAITDIADAGITEAVGLIGFAIAAQLSHASPTPSPSPRLVRVPVHEQLSRRRDAVVVRIANAARKQRARRTPERA